MRIREAGFTLVAKTSDGVMRGCEVVYVDNEDRVALEAGSEEEVESIEAGKKIDLILTDDRLFGIDLPHTRKTNVDLSAMDRSILYLPLSDPCQQE